MIRCQEEPPKDAREDGQAAHSADEENQLKQTRSPSRPRTSGPWSFSISNSQVCQVSRARTSGVQPGHPASARKSGQSPGNPAPRTRNHRNLHLQPGHPASRPGHPVPPEAPDIRPDARTSGSACLRTVKGRAPCTLSPLDYIYFIPFLFLGSALV